MTPVRSIAAMVLFCGTAIGQTVGAAVAGFSDPIWPEGALHEELALHEQQIKLLKELHNRREDEIFPLAREVFEKEWELRRTLRMANPDEDVLETIASDLRRLDEEVQKVNARHRTAAREVLGGHQIAALVRLEKAVASLPAAREAMAANLIGSPEGNGLAWLPFGLYAGGIGHLIHGLIDWLPGDDFETPGGANSTGSACPGVCP